MASGTSSRKIDETWVESKLRMANDSMESVQTLSLWALNHKSEHEQIVNIWLKVFRSADENQMVVLIYLCNDILQTCKRRNALMFKDSFKQALKEAVHLIKGDKPVASFKKILKVWSERNVFEGKYVEELSSLAFGDTNARSSVSGDRSTAQSNKSDDDKANNSSKTSSTITISSSLSSSLNSKDSDAVNNTKSTISNNSNSNNMNDNQKVNITKQAKSMPSLSLSDFNLNRLTKMISQEMKHNIKLISSMDNCNLYLSNIDKITSSKDAEKQKSYLMNKSDEINSICHTFGLLTEQINEKEQLIVHLELAKLYYKERNKDTKLVTSAYKNYASRVQNLSKKLMERRQLLMLSEQSKDDEDDDEEDDGHNNYDDDDSGHDVNKDGNKTDIYDINISEKVNNSNSGVSEKGKNNQNTINTGGSCSNNVTGGDDDDGDTKHSTSTYHDNISFYNDNRTSYNENRSHYLIMNDDNGNDDDKDAENDDDDMLFNQLFTGEMNDNGHDDDLKFATNDKRDEKVKTGTNIRRRASLDERLKMIELGGFSSNFEDDTEPPPAKTSKMSISDNDVGQNIDIGYHLNISKDVEYDGRATPVLDEHSPTSSSSLAPTSSSSLSLAASSSSSSLKSDNKSHQSRLEELFINFKKASGKILKMRNKSSVDDYDDNEHSRNKNKHKHKETKDYKHRDDDDNDDRSRDNSHRHHKSTEKKESESKHGHRTSEHKQDQRSKEDDSRHKSRKDDNKRREDSNKYDDQPPPPPPPARVSDVATSITNNSLLISSDGHTLVTTASSLQYTYDYYTHQMSASIIPATSIMSSHAIYQTINTSDGISQLQAVPSAIDASQYMYEEVLYVFAEEEDALGQLQQLGQLPIQQQQQQLFQGHLANINNNPGNVMITTTTTSSSSSSASDNLYRDKFVYPSVKNDNNLMLMAGQVQQQQQTHQTLSLPITATQNLQQQQLLLQPQQQAPQQQAHIQQYIPVNMPPPIIQPQQLQQPLIIQQQPYSLQIPPPPLPQPSITPQTHLPPPPFAFTQQPPPPLPQTLVSAPLYAPPPQLKQDISLPQPPSYSYTPSSISVISSASSSTYPLGDIAAAATMKGGPRLGRDQTIKPTNVGFIRRPSALTTITLAEDDAGDDGDVYGGNDVYCKNIGGTVYCKAINPSMFSSCVYSSKSVCKSQSYNEIEKMKTSKSVAQPFTSNSIGSETSTELTIEKQRQQQSQLFNSSSNLVLLSSNKNITIPTSTSSYNHRNTSYDVTTAATSDNAINILTTISTSSITTPTATNVIASNNCTSVSNTIQLSTNTTPPATITGIISDICSSAKVPPLPDSSTTTIQTSSNPTNTEKKSAIPAQEPDSSGLADTNYNSSDSSDLEDFPEAVTFTAPLSVVKSNSSLNARQSYLQKQFASIKNSNPMTTNITTLSSTPLLPPRVPLNLFSPSNMNAIANRAVDILMRGGPRAPLLRAPPQPLFRGPVRLPPPPHQPVFPSFSMSSPSRRPRF